MGSILDKLYVIICVNYFDQLLLGYIAYLLIVNHLTVLPSAQAQSYGNGPRHLVYALVYSREYSKDLILKCVLCHNCALFSSSSLHYLNRSHSACECSIGTRQYYASDMGARKGGDGAIQSIISQTNNGCSLLSLILVVVNVMCECNVFPSSAFRHELRKCFCIVYSDCQWRSHGGGGGRGLQPLSPIEPQMTSYITETVRTKCIISEALKVRGQKYDKLSLKIVQRAPKWPLQHANFQKFSRRACSRTPLESFLALKMLKNNSCGKNTLEKSDEN